MKVQVFSSREDERALYERANQAYGFDITYISAPLCMKNVGQARGYDAVQILTATRLDEPLAAALAEVGVRYVLTRSAGIDHLDVEALRLHGLFAANVPDYSPSAIAEHTVMLALMLVRHMKRQFEKVGRLDFTMSGLRGKELASMTVGIYGTGRIGQEAARLFRAFGVPVLAYSRHKRESLCKVARYVSKEELFAQSDLISFHCPLTPQTHHIVDKTAIDAMNPGVFLVNTARGGLFDFAAVRDGLHSGKIAGAALDVYENENRFMRKDKSTEGLNDPVLDELLHMEQVVLTPHVGFYTDEALRHLIETTLYNLHSYASAGACVNEVTRP
ncbi:MAG: NAD(P)-dependent oxidoreductase [Ethanoligenens sp.]